MTDTLTESPTWPPPPQPRMSAALHDISADTVQLHHGDTYTWLDLGPAVLYTPTSHDPATALAELADLGRHITHLAEARLADIAAEACTTTLDPDGRYRHHETCPFHPDATIHPESAPGSTATAHNDALIPRSTTPEAVPA